MITLPSVSKQQEKFKCGRNSLEYIDRECDLQFLVIFIGESFEDSRLISGHLSHNLIFNRSNIIQDTIIILLCEDDRKLTEFLAIGDFLLKGLWDERVDCKQNI